MRSVALVLVLIGVFVSQDVWAASYQRIDGTIVDPIQNTYGGDSAYSGPDLHPGVSFGDVWSLRDAELPYANLSRSELNGIFSRANLSHADFSFSSIEGHAFGNETNFSYADFQSARLDSFHVGKGVVNFSYSNLTDATWTSNSITVDFTGANLNGANLTSLYISAELSNSDFSYARLYSADLSSTSNWSSAIWTGARYSLNARDNSGNSISDTVFPTGFDPLFYGMVAVPEPTTALLVGVGLIGLAMKNERF